MKTKSLVQPVGKGINAKKCVGLVRPNVLISHHATSTTNSTMLRILSSEHQSPQMTDATLRLMTMPQNPELERVINLTKNAVEQLEKQNPLSSLHGTRSRATATAIPQASRTPGGHQGQQQQEQQNRRNQEDQELASSHCPRGGQPQANQAPDPQQNRNNNNRRNNREEVADSI